MKGFYRMKENNKIAVLITTDSSKRGVFMGFIDPKETDKDTVTAEEVRMAVHWTSDVRGVIGLAASGPTKNCKISKAAPKAVIKGVTACVQITDDALKAWRKEPWG